MAPLFVANWKSYVQDAASTRALIKDLLKRMPSKMRGSVVVAPTAPLIGTAVATYSGKRLHYAMQDVALDTELASTGSVIAASVRGSGAAYCIVGHAERRARGDNNQIVADKIRLLIDAKVRPILCIGERARDTEGAYFSDIERDVRDSLQKILPHEIGKLVIAYEPVWAIGAATAPAPRVISEALVFVRKVVAERFGRDAAHKVPVLYGGAVDATNAREILHEGHSNGFLVGRASIAAKEFAAIITACQR